MEKIPFLEVFPCCQGTEKTYGNLHAAFVLEGVVNHARTAMALKVEFIHRLPPLIKALAPRLRVLVDRTFSVPFTSL